LLSGPSGALSAESIFDLHFSDIDKRVAFWLNLLEPVLSNNINNHRAINLNMVLTCGQIINDEKVKVGLLSSRSLKAAVRCLSKATKIENGFKEIFADK